jgi:mannose-6-phosphate isomerase
MPITPPFDHPLTFAPILKSRIWGGTRIASCLGREIPPNQQSVGESWELCDRADDQSRVNHGPHLGTTLNDLWENHRQTVFGKSAHTNPSKRFPLLFKILDATDTLSVQVHPPTHLCQLLKGEPKTEAWHLLDATPNACIYAGFSRPELCQEIFQYHLKEGTVESLLHRIPVRTGDTFFIPSGRCHAIGAGCLIAEIQQNSDTTYRLFDWNRTDSEGQPRELHVDQALACIDFNDLTPQLHPPQAPLVTPLFRFASERIPANTGWTVPDGDFAILHILSGTLLHQSRSFQRGSTLLVPAKLAGELATATSEALVLQITLPEHGNSQDAKEQCETPKKSI